MKSILLSIVLVLCLFSCKKGDLYTCGRYQTDLNAQTILVGDTWTKRFQDDQAARAYEHKQTEKHRNTSKGGDYICAPQ